MREQAKYKRFSLLTASNTPCDPTAAISTTEHVRPKQPCTYLCSKLVSPCPFAASSPAPVWRALLPSSRAFALGRGCVLEMAMEVSRVEGKGARAVTRRHHREELPSAGMIKITRAAIVKDEITLPGGPMYGSFPSSRYRLAVGRHHRSGLGSGVRASGQAKLLRSKVGAQSGAAVLW